MRSLTLIAAAAALMIVPSTGFAAGDGGGSDTRCKQGLVFNPTTQKCEKQNAAAPDLLLINKGMELAYAGDYDAAIDVLWQVEDWRSNARALNYLGFAHRKSGKLDEALSYYKLALAADPDYTLARAYLGEGYLAIDRLDLAEAELAEIAERVGTEAREYKQLASRIAAYKAA